MQNLSSVIRILSSEPNTGVTAWLYNQDNQLLNSVDNQFTYDANGNQVEEKDSSGQLQKQYIYNTENRLSEIKDENGQTIASYYYDPFARRLSKTITDQDTATTTTTYFHYNDEGYSAEKTNGQITSYLFSPQQTWSTSPVLKRENNIYYYYQNDHLGTPNILHDKQGQVVNAREMKAFGEWTNSTSIINDNFAFAGQYKDAETGTYYNFHRDYNPNVGRYIESDPIGLNGGNNLSLYILGNPMKYTDPLGLFCIWFDTYKTPWQTYWKGKWEGWRYRGNSADITAAWLPPVGSVSCYWIRSRDIKQKREVWDRAYCRECEWVQKNYCTGWGEEQCSWKWRNGEKRTERRRTTEEQTKTTYSSISVNYNKYYWSCKPPKSW